MRSIDVVCIMACVAVAGCASGGSATNTSALPGLSSDRAAPALKAKASAFYSVTTFGTFGGTVSSAASINERGWITGSANEAGDTTAHAALWGDGPAKDLGTLGGPSSAIDWPNLDNFGMLAGISETAQMDPYNEPWSCSAFFPAPVPSLHVCVGFTWRNGVMQPLPTLGGPDGYAAGTNDWGQVVGWAENTTMDPTCTNGQVLQFEPVFWDARHRIHQLPTLPGDPDGAATAINDLGPNRWDFGHLRSGCRQVYREAHGDLEPRSRELVSEREQRVVEYAERHQPIRRRCRLRQYSGRGRSGG